jgi:uncharacterized membrane protein YtjA (UPF0391 family)
MLHWAMVFPAVAMVEAIFGLGGIAGRQLQLPGFSFVIFLALLVMSLTFGGRGGILT